MITKKAFYDRIFFSPDGCWLWIGSTGSRGYGRFPQGRKDKSTLAHRGSYTMHKGVIPTGIDVCHTCDNPICVNPDHLFLGTHQDNMNDMKNKGRQKSLCGSQNPGALITENQAIQVKGLLLIGLQPTLISKCLHIGVVIVQNIKRGVAWKHVPSPKIYGL